MIEAHLSLRAFRDASRLTLTEIAERLGVHKTTVMRIETGEVPTDADMVERIVALTDGAVTAADMHAVRLAWLKVNRPDKFAAPLPDRFEPVREAAE